jgi:hypothetical protein
MPAEQIPDVVLLAAAKALHEADRHDEWDDEGCNDTGGGAYTSCKDWTIHLAGAVLEAALPVERERIARELETEAAKAPSAAHAEIWAFRLAARIARGES